MSVSVVVIVRLVYSYIWNVWYSVFGVWVLFWYVRKMILNVVVMKNMR